MTSESTKKKKFLVLRFSSIGDIVLTTPVVRCLKQKYPDAEIHYATKKGFSDLLRYNPYIDKLWLLDQSIQALIQDLKQEHFDAIIDLHHNLRTWWIKLQLWNIPSYAFPKLNVQKWLYVRFKMKVMPEVHIVNRYMKTLEKLDVVNDGKGLDFFVPAEGRVDLAKHFQFQNKAFAVFVIGAKFETKQLPIENMASWCRRIKMPIVLLGGKEDKHRADELCRMLPNLEIYNGTGMFSLIGSASVIQQAHAVFTHDTGMMHIAAAFQKPIVSFWGNTTPQLGMYPYLIKESFIVENKEINCRPCSKIGFHQCPKGHFNCMRTLKPENYNLDDYIHLFRINQ